MTMIKYREHIPEEFTKKTVGYRRFAIGIQFKDKVYGSIPNQLHTIQAWYASRGKAEEAANVAESGQAADQPANPLAGTAEEMAQEVELAKPEAPPVDVFRRDRDGIFFQDALYIKNHQIKAMLKQTASLLRITTAKRGSKQTLAEGMTLHGVVTMPDDRQFLTQEKVFMQPVRTEPDGEEGFTGHVTGPQGTRSIIKVNEFVKACHLQFEIRLLAVRMGDHANSKDITPQDLFNIMEHGQSVGIGGNRSFASGHFKLQSFEEVTQRPILPIFGQDNE